MSYNDYNDYRDYRRDRRNDYRRDYSYRNLDHFTRDYHDSDKFQLEKREIVDIASKMGASFRDYGEEELYLAYLVMQRLFKSLGNNVERYVVMAKDFLEQRNAREKLDILINDIVD